MTHRLYGVSARWADWSTGIMIVVFLGAGVQRLVLGYTGAAAVLAGVAGLIGLLRFFRGPLRGPVLIEIGPAEIVFRQRFYIPTRVQRVPNF